MEIIKRLTGHSGCEVILCKKNEEYFIRKKSMEVAYNERLEAQIKKQIEVSTFEQSYFKVPIVKNIGIENWLYYADMEFIKGTTIINYLLNTNYKSILVLIDKIICIIEYFSKLEISEQENYFEKILLKTNETLLKTNLGEKLQNKFYITTISKIEEFKKFTPSFCHGDFTLENIMITSNGELYLIDFLDNFSQQINFDIVKIYQDIEGEWYKIKNEDMKIPKIKLLFFKELFDKKIEEKFKEYKKIHYYLLALTFLRILPYTKDKKKYLKIKVMS